MISYQFGTVYTGFIYALEALKVCQASLFHQKTMIQAIFKEANSYKHHYQADTASCSGSLRSGSCFGKGSNIFNYIFRSFDYERLSLIHHRCDVTTARISVISGWGSCIFLLVSLYPDFLTLILSDLYFVGWY